MAFQNIYPNDILQAKKECLIKFATDKRVNNTYNSVLKIQYPGVFPALVKGSITFEGIEYIYSVAPGGFVANMNSFYELFRNFIITIDSTNNRLVFTKRDKNVKDFTHYTTDGSLLSFVTATENIPDVNYTIGLTIVDASNNILANFSKTTPLNGFATFEISSILKNNISHDLILWNSFDVFPTNLFRKFQLACSAIANTSSNTIVNIFATKTNLSEADFGYLTQSGTKLCVNNNRRYVADNSNEKLYFLWNSAMSALTITAYTYGRRASEVYTKDISGLAVNTIYEVPTSWQCVKDLFSVISDDDIVEYVVKVDQEEITYVRKDFQGFHEFIFINKYSVWDNIIFDAKNEERLDIQKSDIQSKEKITTISKQLYTKRVQNTGFITNKDKREHIQDLISSEKVFEVVNEMLVEVIINSDNYLMKQLDIREMHNIQFEYSYANFKNII